MQRVGHNFTRHGKKDEEDNPKTLPLEKLVEIIDPSLLSYYLEKISIFLKNTKKDLWFPLISPELDAFLVRMIHDEQNLRGLLHLLDMKSRESAMDILKTLKDNEDVYKLVHSYDSSSTNRHTLVYKKIFCTETPDTAITNQVLLLCAPKLPAIEGTSMPDSPPENKQDALHGFKPRWLTALMTFLGNADAIKMEFLQLTIDEAELLASVIKNPRPEIHRLKPLWDRLRQSSLVENLTVSYVHNGSLISLVVERSPKKNKQIDKPESQEEITKMQKAFLRKKELMETVDPDFVHTSLRMILEFLSADQDGAIVFHNASEEQSAFLQSVFAMAKCKKMHSLFDEEGQSLLRKIVRQLNIVSHVQLKMEVEKKDRDSQLRTVRIIKEPKINHNASISDNSIQQPSTSSNPTPPVISKPTPNAKPINFVQSEPTKDKIIEEADALTRTIEKTTVAIAKAIENTDVNDTITLDDLTKAIGQAKIIGDVQSKIKKTADMNKNVKTYVKTNIDKNDKELLNKAKVAEETKINSIEGTDKNINSDKIANKNIDSIKTSDKNKISNVESTSKANFASSAVSVKPTESLPKSSPVVSTTITTELPKAKKSNTTSNVESSVSKTASLTTEKANVASKAVTSKPSSPKSLSEAKSTNSTSISSKESSTSINSELSSSNIVTTSKSPKSGRAILKAAVPSTSDKIPASSKTKMIEDKAKKVLVNNEPIVVRTEQSDGRPLPARKVKLLKAMAVPVESDKAMRMMRQMGWEGGPLGTRGEGIIEPIVPDLHITEKAGLGHVKPKPPPPTPKSKNFRLDILKNINLLIIEEPLKRTILYGNQICKKERGFLLSAVVQLNKRGTLQLNDEQLQSAFKIVMEEMQAEPRLEISALLNEDRRSVTIAKNDVQKIKLPQEIPQPAEPEEVMNIVAKYGKANYIHTEMVTHIAKELIPNLTSKSAKGFGHRIVVLAKILDLLKSDKFIIYLKFEYTMTMRQVHYAKEMVASLNIRSKLSHSDHENYLFNEIFNVMGDFHVVVDFGHVNRTMTIAKRLFKKPKEAETSPVTNNQVATVNNNNDKILSKENDKVTTDKTENDQKQSNNDKVEVQKQDKSKSQNNEKQINNEKMANDQKQPSIDKTQNAQKQSTNDKGQSVQKQDKGKTQNDYKQTIDKTQVEQKPSSDKSENNKKPINDKTEKDQKQTSNDRKLNDSKENDKLHVKTKKVSDNVKCNKLANRNDDVIVISSDSDSTDVEDTKILKESDKMAKDLDVRVKAARSLNSTMEAKISEAKVAPKATAKVNVEKIVEEPVIKNEKEDLNPSKRLRSDSNDSKKVKKTKLLIPKYLCIAPDSYPIDEVNFEIIQKFQTLVCEKIKNNKEKPLIECVGLKNGALIYGCHNEYGRILIESVAKEMDLKTTNITNLYKDRKRYKIKARINSYLDINLKKLFVDLEDYNEGLKTDNWTVTDVHKNKDNIEMLIEIDGDSFDYISQNAFALFSGMDRVRFCVIWN